MSDFWGKRILYYKVSKVIKGEIIDEAKNEEISSLVVETKSGCLWRLRSNFVIKVRILSNELKILGLFEV